MANERLKKELEKQEEELQKILKGIEKMPTTTKGSITKDINQVTETLTENITIANTKKIEREYEQLLQNKNINKEQATQTKNNTLKQRITAKVIVTNKTGDVGIFNIIGFIPEEKSIVYNYLNGRIIPSNEWLSTATGLQEELQTNSEIPVTVLNEETAQGQFTVQNIIVQTTLQ